MTEFLDPENPCGTSLLQLVSRGQAILAELQRLSQNIPSIFYGKKDESQKYDKLLIDFQYWNQIDEFEKQVQSDLELNELDEHFRDTYMELLERFYIIFESIHTYHSDILQILEEITSGVFVQFSFENLLQHVEGKKLICEMFYIYGCMLLLMDKLIIGPIRERIVVQYNRYKRGKHSMDNLSDIIKLTASTGYLPASYTGTNKDQRPKFYPEELFSRFSFDYKYIDAIINTIKEDDIYQCKSAYSQEQSSFALAQQGGMLYILLFFYGDIMESKKSKMRELVDKHYSDNWVVPYYLGYYVDLTVEWQDYDAARKALENTLDMDYIKGLSNQYNAQLEESYNLCEEYLIEGVMDEEYVLFNNKNLIKCLTKSNITIKWLMLHKNSSLKKVRDIINEKLKIKDILSLLLISSQFESKLIQCLENLIKTKQDRWDYDKNTCIIRMKEVSEIFGGQRSTLGNVTQDQTFFRWFTQMSEKINNLQFSNSTSVGRKLNQLIQALDDIENYHQLSQNQSIRYYLAETKKDLQHMIKISTVESTMLTRVSLIADISYAWQCLNEYVPLIQDKIQKHPAVSLLLKSTFQKLSSILNIPMVRIIQAHSSDMESVSKYYSGELIKFVKNILQIIPQEVFNVLEQIILVLKDKLIAIPWKFKKDELKTYTQYDERKIMANQIYRISLLTQSILGMETYLIGVIEVDPKQILDEGIRKELIKLIFKVFDDNLQFKSNNIIDFEQKLNQLSITLGGFKKAIENIQDFIQAYGIKLFHEEFDRLINCYIDMEQSFQLSGTMQFEQLLYDDDIPMPSFKQTIEPGTVNFMGRLLKTMVQLTDQKTTIYIDHALGFYEVNTGREILTMKALGLLYRCIGLSGLTGLDRLISYDISAQMHSIIKLFKMEINEQTQKELSYTFNKDLKHLTAFTSKHEELFPKLKLKLKNLLQELIPRIQKLGQMILLRKIICLQLQIMAKTGSQRLFLCMENLNNGISNDMNNRIYDKKMSEEDTLKENELIYEASKLFNFIGISEPLNKIYMTPEHLESLPLIFSLLTSIIIPFIDYDTRINSLVKKISKEKEKKVNDYEPNYFLYGTLTFLNQFHQNNRDIYFGFLALHIKSLFNQMLNVKEPQKQAEIVTDLLMNIKIYDEFLKISGESLNSHLNQQLPIELINSYKKIMTTK